MNKWNGVKIRCPHMETHPITTIWKGRFNDFYGLTFAAFCYTARCDCKAYKRKFRQNITCCFLLFLPAVSVISTEVTYVLGGLVFAWIVEEWVWDYAITVTLLHVAMTVAGKDSHTHPHKVAQ